MYYKIRDYRESDYDSIVELYNSSTLKHEYDSLNEEQKTVILIAENNKKELSK